MANNIITISVSTPIQRLLEYILFLPCVSKYLLDTNVHERGFFFAYLLHYLNESTYFVYMCVCGKWLVFVKQHFPFFSRNNWIIGSNLSFSNAYYDKELLLSNIKLARSWKQISTFLLFLGEKLLQKPFFLQMCFTFLWC